MLKLLQTGWKSIQFKEFLGLPASLLLSISLLINIRTYSCIFIIFAQMVNFFSALFFQDGRISYEEFVAMMKTGTDWRKASRQYSRERFKSLSLNLMKDGSLQLHDAATGQAIAV